MSLEERILQLILRVGGGVMLTAFAAVFLPVEWMEACHRWLGLGDFPRAPLTEYLTRSISALYGVHGGMFLVLSSDVRRMRPAIRVLALLNLLFGVLVFGIDLHAGLPWYWTAAEGPPVVGVALVLLYLVGRVPEPGPPAAV